MTQSDEYQKACERAAHKYYDEQIEKGELNSRHMDDLSQAFQAGIAYANANPSPRVMRLVEALGKIKLAIEQITVREKTSKELVIHEWTEEALADFEGK